jgi:ABC-2 family transporter protein
MQRFLAILVADLRERSRATRFWVVLGVVAIVTWWCFPPLDAGYMTVSLGAGVRAHYSSAWVGMVLGLMYSTMLSLFGFYLVRGTLVRDFDTRVWQLLVATPMTRPGYLLAKWTSHMVVFALIMAIGLVIGLAAQWWRAEDRHIDVIELVKPVLWLSLPALGVTAMFAVLFDLLPWLRRTAGNVLYFFVWVTLFAVFLNAINPEKMEWARHTWISDPNGMTLAIRDLQAHIAVTTPGQKISGMSIGSNIYEGRAILFDWTHWSPRWSDIFGRLLWPLFAIFAVMGMAPLLDWAAARTRALPASAAASPGRKLRWLDRVLSPLDRFGLGTLLAAELKLVLRQRRIWWWLALVVLAAIQLFGTLEAVGIACIGAWLISTDVLARGVLRERESGTSALIFTAADARSRLLIVRTLTALALTVVPVLPALLRFSATQPRIAIAVLMIAATVAIAGLAMGALCRNPRPFELLLVMLAYVGVQGQSTLNAMLHPAATLSQHVVALPILAALLLLLWPRHTRAG